MRFEGAAPQGDDVAKDSGNGHWRNRIIEYGTRPASQFQAHPRNWRKHPKAQREALAASLNGVGWVGVVLENARTGHLLDGHERLWQALEQGDETPVPYITVDLAEDEEHLVLATLDPIGAMAETDAEMLAGLLAELGDVPEFDAEDVSALLAEIAEQTGVEVERDVPADPGPQIDRAEELRDQWQTERGQVWEILSASVPGRAHRLMCGDSTSADDVATLMQGEKAGAVVTDPPYSILGGGTSIAGKGIKAAFDRQFFRAWFEKFYNTVTPCMMINSGFWLTIDWRGATAIEEALVGTRYRLAALGVWDRGGLGMGYILRRTYENFAVIVAEGFERTTTDEPDVWRVQWTPGDREQGHSAEKPIELIVRAIKLLGGDLVLDPFLGGGTTLVACEQTGRICYGMEIEPKYVAVALQRLSDMGLVARRADA